jgi:hypothetical protein
MYKFGFKIFNHQQSYGTILYEPSKLLSYSSDTDLINNNIHFNEKIALFCYGSNSISQLKERLKKDNIIVKKAHLPRHTRIFAGHSNKWNGGVASIMPSYDNYQVKGSIIYVYENDLKKIDKFEGAHKNENPFSRNNNIYRRKYIDVLDENNNKIQAITYIKNNHNWVSYPSNEYLKAVKNNVQEFWDELDENEELFIYDNNLTLKGKY